MKKIIVLLVSVVYISSCISKKEHAALQSKHNKTKDELLAVKNSLTKCVIDNEKCDADVANLNNIIADLKSGIDDEIAYMALLKNGIESLPLSVYCLAPIERSALILGFSGVQRKHMPKLVKKMSQILRTIH